MPDMKSFESELEVLINKHSLENHSNTPDFIIARAMVDSYWALVKATNRRAQWYEHTNGGPGTGGTQL